MCTSPESCLNGLDLHGDCRENGLLESVELIEAAPRPTLDDTNEDTTHTPYINTLNDRSTNIPLHTRYIPELAS